MTAAWIALVAVLGSLIGSFANVVVYRWPRGESVVRPRSRCPGCGRTLSPIDLLPVLSWIALRGRCRTCGARIAARYPAVEAGFALAFGVLAWAYPVEAFGPTVVPLLVLVSMLGMAALIDLDTYLLPDGLTLPAVAVGVLGAWVYHPDAGLPNVSEAAVGAAVAAGVLVLINRLGGLVLRRLRDTGERLWPFSLDAVNVAAVAGMLGGRWWALAAGLAQVAASALARRPVRLAEPWLYALWLAALVVALSGWTLTWGVDLIEALAGSLIGAGALALLGAAWWWAADLRASEPQKAPAEEAGRPEDDDGEPVAMGFGDVKLAAVLGALLGVTGFMVGLLLAVVIGAVVGVAQRALGGSRFVPFGPFLVVGALLAWVFADGLVGWYLALLGV
jgi:leader peptidase (prepilin peptidase) / N-methyltransferase